MFGIHISTIFYDGVEGRSEADEFIEITNDTDARVDLNGYLINAGTGSATSTHRFTFTQPTPLDPGESLRVYTNKDPGGKGWTFGSGTAIWNNHGGTGRLIDTNTTPHSEVSSYTYPRAHPDPIVTSNVIVPDGSHNFGQAIVGTGHVDVQFAIENRSVSDVLKLSGTPVVTVSKGAGDFEVRTQPVQQINPVATGIPADTEHNKSRFVVRFHPTNEAPITGELTIPVEGMAPITVRLQGVGITPAHLVLLQDGVDVSASGTYDFGSVAEGSHTTKTFTLINTGGSPATLQNISVAAGGVFSVGSLPTFPKTLNAHEQVDFTVEFNAGAVGPQTDFLIVDPGATDSHQITVQLSGTVVHYEPNIALSTGGAPVPDQSISTIGSALTNGAEATKTFTISNSGNSTLTISSIAVSGGDGTFTVDPPLAGHAIPAGGTADFTVHFNPQNLLVAPGQSKAETAQITINSDDPDSGAYSFTASATAVSPAPPLRPQQLVVRQFDPKSQTYDSPYTNGQTITYNMIEHEEAGNPFAAVALSVGNSGELPLTLTSANLSDPMGFVLTSDVSTPGGHAPSFPITIQPGQSIPLYVVYRKSGGTSTALTLHSDDPANPLYTLHVNVIDDASGWHVRIRSNNYIEIDDMVHGRHLVSELVSLGLEVLIQPPGRVWGWSEPAPYSLVQPYDRLTLSFDNYAYYQNGQDVPPYSPTADLKIGINAHQGGTRGKISVIYNGVSVFYCYLTLVRYGSLPPGVSYGIQPNNNPLPRWRRGRW